MRLLKIGRDAGCDIVLHSDKVSSLHAEITLMNSGDIMLEDKGSRNGTFIMNQQIKPGKPVNIRRGDAIRFADVELQWGQVPMPEDNSAYKAIYGIGSHFNNDIQISGGTVSRYHATIKIGRDNKVYIIDHSKNGTTVDGNKIPSNNPVRIKKSSSVVCGGVPVNLKDPIVKWPKEVWKIVALIVACLCVLVGAGWGIHKYIQTHMDPSFEDGQLYSRYKNSAVYVKTVYHYEVSIGDLNSQEIVALGIPQKLLPLGDSYQDVSGMTSSELLDALDKMYERVAGNNKSEVRNQGLGAGTGFFISSSGEIVTNLHVVKPWLFNKDEEFLEGILSRFMAQKVATRDAANVAYLKRKATVLSAYTSKIKVKGVLDYIAIVPNDALFDKDNVIKCRVLSADQDRKNIEKDVALIQTVTKHLPNADCAFVNVKDSMDIRPEVYKAGEHVYVLGFPAAADPFMQNDANRTGIHCYGTGGNITVDPTEYSFSFDAAALHGSSGSAIFNRKGMLIGILNSGKGDNFNRGVKAKYIKEILEKPHDFN